MPQPYRSFKLKYPGPAASSIRTPKSKRTRLQKGRAAQDPTAGLQIQNPNAAAIDVGGAEHWVALPPHRTSQPVRRFGCCTKDLQELADCLVEHGVDTVVMEATGNYWVALYEMLEERQRRPVLVNARYAKNMSGKKGDIPDCQWMQKLHSYGLFANSFRPAEPVRVLRAYMRQREMLVGEASRSIQHMQKALTEMNVQLANVISDISGETGLLIIDAILAGQRALHALARLRDRSIRASEKEITRALEGHWKEEQLFILEQARLSYAHTLEQIAACDQRLQEQTRALENRVVEASPAGAVAASPPTPLGQGLESKGQAAATPFRLGTELKRILGVDLTKIPGVGPLTAQVVLSEIGTDVNAWPSEKHFASWLGLSPDHRISGGKILGRSTRPVVHRVRTALRLSAYSLERSLSAMGAKYRRLKRRLGAPKAITAMAHYLARLIWRLIREGQEYVEKGMELYEARYRAQRIRWLEKQAAEFQMKLVANA